MSVWLFTLLFFLFALPGVAPGSNLDLMIRKSRHHGGHGPLAKEKDGVLSRAQEAFRAWLDSPAPLRLGGEPKPGNNFFHCKEVIEEVPVEEETEICEPVNSCSEEGFEVCEPGCFVGLCSEKGCFVREKEHPRQKYFLLEEGDPFFLGQGVRQCSNITELLQSHCIEKSKRNAEICHRLTELAARVLHGQQQQQEFVCRECDVSCVIETECKAVKKCRTVKKVIAIKQKVVQKICNRI